MLLAKHKIWQLMKWRLYIGHRKMDSVYCKMYNGIHYNLQFSFPGPWQVVILGGVQASNNIHFLLLLLLLLPMLLLLDFLKRCSCSFYYSYPAPVFFLPIAPGASKTQKCRHMSFTNLGEWGNQPALPKTLNPPDWRELMSFCEQGQWSLSRFYIIYCPSSYI